jgi:hypothetical protein
MGLLDNGGRELGQWPPFPLKHFQEKWNPVLGQKSQRSQQRDHVDDANKSMQHSQEQPAVANAAAESCRGAL